uniref:Uncharacterized protein n=1 Tax=Helianthus annuus TaxID=4232 RepID=A0A251UHS5_HELAN
MPLGVFYWILQGSVQMGLWVIGHECGYQAFSNYTWLNDTIGYITRACLHRISLGNIVIALLYVCSNVSSQKYEKFANHFDPKSPVYNDRECSQILMTGVGLIVTSYGLYKLALAQGFTWLMMWNWLRGALAIIDRDYCVFNRVLHHITDTHVAHHLLFTIPHYHAMEATKAIKPTLGEYYQFDDTLIIKAMWRETTECFFVEGDEAEDKSKGICWFNNKM